ncbi:Panacea domain-containing protein [Brevibacterium sediminis]
MADVKNVAQFIVELAGGRIETMKLQKLLYFAQGWNLAWDGNKLFDSEIKAWKYGPVVTEIYPLHRRQPAYDLERDGALGDSNELTLFERVNVMDVFNFYDAFNGFELAELSHQHSPWVRAYTDAAPTQRGNVTISIDDIEQFFVSMNEDGTDEVIPG